MESEIGESGTRTGTKRYYDENNRITIMITDHKENSEHRAMVRMITSNMIMMMMMRQQYCP